MKSRRSALAMIAAVAALLFLWNRNPAAPDAEHASIGTIREKIEALSVSASPTISGSLQKWTPEVLRGRAFSILGLASQRDRLREFCELLRYVTAENAEAVREAADILRRREGRMPQSALLLLEAHLDRLASGREQIAHPPVALSPTEVPAALASLATMDDELEKMRRFFEILPGITKENWREALAALTEPSGPRRPLAQSRRIMLRTQIGETAGPLAFEQGWDDPQIGWDIFLRAWTESSPAAALAWLAEQPEDVKKPAARYQVAFGICPSDPHRAWSLLSEDSDDARRSSGEDGAHMVYRIADSSGFRAAEAFFNVFRQDPRSSKETIQKAFYKLTEARELMLIRGTPQDATAALEWLDLYLPSGVKPISSFLGSTAKLNPDHTRAWLDTHRDRMDEELRVQSYRNVAKVWHAKSPTSFQAWLHAHPDHPQQAIMAAAITPTSKSQR